VSIVRQGLAEDGKFADGYDAIFAKKSGGEKPAKAVKKSGDKPPEKKKTAKKK
jgi:hypothetical protein